METTHKRVHWLDVLRGFALICVIAGHPVGMPDDIKTWVYSFHMPLFFLISGATFRYEKYKSFGDCIKGQARRLLLPYVTLYLVCTPLWYVNKVVFSGSTETVTEMLSGMLFAQVEIAPMPNGALWFLPTLFLVSVAYWKLYDLHEKEKLDLSGSITFCFFMGLVIALFFDIQLPWHIQCVPLLVFFYAAGQIGFRLLESPLVQRLTGWEMMLVAVLALAIGTWAGFANGRIDICYNSYGNLALVLVSSFGISLGLALMFMRLPRIKALDYMGRHSLIVFGMHVPVMRFLENCPATALLHGHPLWIAAATFLILFPVTWVVDHWLPFVVGKWYTRGKKRLN